MKKLNFLATCPGCGDTHVELKCYKPTFITPTIATAVCDKCESPILYQVSLPRNRETKRQVSYVAVKITASAKLVEIINHKKVMAAAEKVMEDHAGTLERLVDEPSPLPNMGYEP